MIKHIGLAGLALALLSTTALAQSRYVAFGDSLSDNGNLFALTGGTTPPSPPYNRRFSNGLVAVEYLAGPLLTSGVPTIILGQPVNNTSNIDFAFGGAETSRDGGALPPSLRTQVGAFVARGGRFNPGDTVTVWAGANNIFNNFAAAAANPATAQTVIGGVGAAAAVDVGTSVGQVAALGARQIVVINLPSFASLPNFTALGTSAASLAGVASSSFNTTLSAQLAAVAAANPGANIVTVDLASSFGAIIANPGAFGFSNVSQQCVQVAACVTGSLATQNQFLFWDGVHPTDAGYRLAAAVATQYITAPQRAASSAALSETGLWQRRSTAIRAMDRLAASNVAPGKWDYTVAAVGDVAQVGATGLKPGYNWATGGLQVTALRGFDSNFTAGVALSAVTGDASTGVSAGNKLTFSPTAFEGDLLARYRFGAFHVAGNLGAGFLNYGDYRRKTYIGNLESTASPNGAVVSGTLEAGATYKSGSFGVVPVARIGYLWSNTGGFSESGVVAPITFSNRTASAFTGGVELKVTADLAPGSIAYALVGYEGFFGQSNDAVRGVLVNNSARPFATGVSTLRSPGVQLGAGVSATLGGFALGADYRVAIGDGGKAKHTGALTLKSTF